MSPGSSALRYMCRDPWILQEWDVVVGTGWLARHGIAGAVTQLRMVTYGHMSCRIGVFQGVGIRLWCASILTWKECRARTQVQEGKGSC
jgi:hypothetical protein